MFGILGFFIFIIFIIVIIALTIVGNILSAILRFFGINKHNQKKDSYTRNGGNQYNSSSSNSANNGDSTSNEHKGKIIGKEEGEYIDFQEIK